MHLVTFVALLAGVIVCFGCGHGFVESSRLIEPENLNEEIPKLEWGNLRTLTTSGAGVLLTDPIYLADIYNQNYDEIAAFLRAKGVILCDFGGDTGADVWWQPPYLKMPLSSHHSDSVGEDEDLPVPKGVVVLGSASCDSGSFVFLPLDIDLPKGFRKTVAKLVAENNASVLKLPAGTYRFYYEQFKAPEENMVGLYRDIVAEKQ